MCASAAAVANLTASSITAPSVPAAAGSAADGCTQKVAAGSQQVRDQERQVRSLRPATQQMHHFSFRFLALPVALRYWVAASQPQQFLSISLRLNARNWASYVYIRQRLESKLAFCMELLQFRSVGSTVARTSSACCKHRARRLPTTRSSQTANCGVAR